MEITMIQLFRFSCLSEIRKLLGTLWMHGDCNGLGLEYSGFRV